MSRSCDDECDVATEGSHQEHAHHAFSPGIGPPIDPGLFGGQGDLRNLVIRRPDLGAAQTNANTRQCVRRARLRVLRMLAEADFLQPCRGPRMTREHPAHAGRHCENGKARRNISFHDYPRITSGRLLGVIGKFVSANRPPRLAAERIVEVRRRTRAGSLLAGMGDERTNRRMTMWYRLALIGGLVGGIGGGAASAADTKQEQPPPEAAAKGATAEKAGVIEPKADAALHRMSDYLSGLKTLPRRHHHRRRDQGEQGRAEDPGAGRFEVRDQAAGRDANRPRQSQRPCRVSRRRQAVQRRTTRTRTSTRPRPRPPSSTRRPTTRVGSSRSTRPASICSRAIRTTR